MAFQAPGSFAERIAHYLAERIARGEREACERSSLQKVCQAFERSGAEWPTRSCHRQLLAR
jgi:hypothetical protein